MPLNTWTHLATTYDGANVRLYLNGALAATRAATGAITVSTGALQIGGNSVWSEWFKGLIDEVRVYSRALSAGTEIAADRDRAVVPAGQFVSTRTRVNAEGPHCGPSVLSGTNRCA